MNKGHLITSILFIKQFMNIIQAKKEKLKKSEIKKE